jgi:conserved hypothetical protein
LPEQLASKVAALLQRFCAAGGGVRALTRNPNASQARLLAQAGAEVVAAPLPLGQEETWLKAFRGADGVFLMTPPTPPENSGEFEPGCRLADAAV